MSTIETKLDKGNVLVILPPLLTPSADWNIITYNVPDYIKTYLTRLYNQSDYNISFTEGDPSTHTVITTLYRHPSPMEYPLNIKSEPIYQLVSMNNVDRICKDITQCITDEKFYLMVHESVPRDYDTLKFISTIYDDYIGDIIYLDEGQTLPVKLITPNDAGIDL